MIKASYPCKILEIYRERGEHSLSLHSGIQAQYFLNIYILVIPEKRTAEESKQTGLFRDTDALSIITHHDVCPESWGIVLFNGMCEFQPVPTTDKTISLGPEFVP